MPAPIVGVLVEVAGRLVLGAMDERAKRKLAALTPERVQEMFREVHIVDARARAEAARLAAAGDDQGDDPAASSEVEKQEPATGNGATEDDGA